MMVQLSTLYTIYTDPKCHNA